MFGAKLPFSVICTGPFSSISPSILDAPGLYPNKIACPYEYQHATYPPFSHIAHGAEEFSSAPAVNDPLLLSKAQKKSVSFGWFVLFTGIFPAQERFKGKVTFGNESFTRKSKMQVDECRKSVEMATSTHILAIPD